MLSNLNFAFKQFYVVPMAALDIRGASPHSLFQWSRWGRMIFWILERGVNCCCWGWISPFQPPGFLCASSKAQLSQGLELSESSKATARGTWLTVALGLSNRENWQREKVILEQIWDRKVVKRGGHKMGLAWNCGRGRKEQVSRGAQQERSPAWWGSFSLDIKGEEKLCPGEAFLCILLSVKAGCWQELPRLCTMGRSC